ncbi:MAG: hypothetical protein HN731_15655 [Rhodospirillaceae bacterium]|jgi:tetratricopeptide (TPR) repeat protein|nr:hypothetical protein [Rhodospirillaceae bacterium]MBT7956628.1 hypothetical protein [Rhodospirillaceae bacterium]
MNRTVFLLLLFILGSSFPVAAQEIDAKKEYARCMELAKSKPQKGFDAAIAWIGLGGGDAAKHCLAVSLLELKQYKEAATRLETLAQEIRAPKAFRASLFGQAGQAWLMADNPSHAMEILTAAIKLDPKNLNFYIDRAQIAAAQKNYKSALKDLDIVLEEEPGYVDALVFRASAKRQLNQRDSAAVDIGHALAKNEDHLEGLLERGMLRRLLNDISGARSDWLKIINLAPDSETARFAREKIQNMDGAKNR